MENFWICDGEFTGQAAEDLAAIYDDLNDRDWTPDEDEFPTGCPLCGGVHTGWCE